MRYLLYETNQGKTTLKLELEFIESYINLIEQSDENGSNKGKIS